LAARFSLARRSAGRGGWPPETVGEGEIAILGAVEDGGEETSFQAGDAEEGLVGEGHSRQGNGDEVGLDLTWRRGDAEEQRGEESKTEDAKEAGLAVNILSARPCRSKPQNLLGSIITEYPMFSTERPKIVAAEGFLSFHKLFKFLILLLGYLFLLVFSRQSENGRYALHNVDHGVIRIDTRTGEVTTPLLKTDQPWK
jgi:hypothetical protein